MRPFPAPWGTLAAGSANPAMPNGRCRMHGGEAGRKPTHGRYTKAAIAERREVRVLLRALRELFGLTVAPNRFLCV